ncbi:hypothetical protein GCM10011591_38540 [Nocardia camponoti]|uniref:Uncharacterized protein n=1 Tax=Nocardia camponoti TaxID=1616106 RepID=A0A917QQ10_9NOCA|nr:hypothetical protein GCM10011591_38540 [Nocardia camponoti]
MVNTSRAQSIDRDGNAGFACREAYFGGDTETIRKTVSHFGRPCVRTTTPGTNRSNRDTYRRISNWHNGTDPFAQCRD